MMAASWTHFLVFNRLDRLQAMQMRTTETFSRGVMLPEPRFRDNGNGTIRDNLTGLLWTKDAGCMGDTTWEETQEGASTIGDGDCGLTDGSEPGNWAVANINVLKSLVDHGNNSPALAAGHPFAGIEPTTALWSSTTADSDSTHAFILDLENGEVIINPKSGTAGCMLWCKIGQALACLDNNLCNVSCTAP